jgi:hypothetical protein
LHSQWSGSMSAVFRLRSFLRWPCVTVSQREPALPSPGAPCSAMVAWRAGRRLRRSSPVPRIRFVPRQARCRWLL